VPPPPPPPPPPTPPPPPPPNSDVTHIISIAILAKWINKVTKTPRSFISIKTT
jgi:hypothetical protein